MSSPPRPLLADLHWHDEEPDPPRWREPDAGPWIRATAAWLRRVLPWVFAAVALWGVTMIAARVVVEMWRTPR